MTKDPLIYLFHIRDALESIEQFTEQGKKHFLRYELTQAAVIYKLAIIGEAVKKLPKTLRDTHPSIPWRQIAGLRDIVIHEYDGTDIPKIWSIVEDDLPTLRKTIHTMIKKRS